MISPGMSLEDISANGVAGKIMGLEPPLVMDDFGLYYPKGDGFKSAILDAVRNRGVWEPFESMFIINEAASGGVMLDIGAHLGYFGFLASRASGGGIEVHMFEPASFMCDAINKTSKYGDFPEHKIFVYPHAVANETGLEVVLRGPEGDSGSSTMVGGTMEGPNGTIASVDFSTSFTSTTIRIDDLNIPEVNLIKMDIEGYEYEAWKGMRETIKRSPNLKVIMETGAYHPQEFRDEWREDFDEYVFDYDGSLVPAPEQWLDKIPATNAVLVKR